MEFKGLWNKLEISEDKLYNIKKDWTEGKVPDLPFMIIDQQQLKSHIEKKLNDIDGDRMTTTVIQAHYGNGKTNVLKYLSLYFDTYYRQFKVKLLYCRADVDQTDICLFLLRHLQDACFEDLIESIKHLREKQGFRLENLVNDFKEDFAAIKEYAEKLFDKKQDDETMKTLLYLGTGRLYSVGAFNKVGLQKLTDFNRREIFVLFMNILSACNRYIVFAVDELEKINDKSPKRMTYFFNSYRELIDLFNKVKGHYLITTLTNAVKIESLSPPFWGRVRDNIVVIERISKKDDLQELTKLMGNLIGVEVTKTLWSRIERRLSRDMGFDSNRIIIQTIASILRNSDHITLYETFEECLNKNPEVKVIYEDAYKRAEEDGGFNNLSRALFDPLMYYLEALGYQNVEDNLLRRDYQAFVDYSSRTAFMFLFNDETKVKSRILDLKENKGIERFFVFVSKGLYVTYSSLGLDDIEIRLIEYDPRKLFVLLNIYRWNFDYQDDIFKLIGIITESVFE